MTAVWKTLLERFPSRLSIETHTAATAITTSPSTTHPYDVHTSRGSIRARHVVHCTNAFATHLVPGLRGKMTSVLAHMSAQRPGPLFTTTSDTTHFPAPTPQKPGSAARSWSVIHASGFDYVVQRPPVEPDGSPLQTVREGSGGRITGLGGDLMLGGGFSRTDSTFLSQIGVWDDSICRPLPVAHLLGVFGAVFREECWAGRSLSDSGVRTGSASVGGTSGALAAGPALRKAWTGIICLTADRRPFVGRLDARVTGRKCSATPSSTSKSKTKSQTSQSLPIGTSSSTTTPGEWIAAGFVGDGMVWAWLSGMAVAVMLSGRENEDLPAAPGRPAGKLADWFPDDLYATYERVQKADLAKAFAELA